MFEKNVLILGLGVSGQSVAKFLHKRKIPFVCVDKAYEKLNQESFFQKLGLQVQGEDALINWPDILEVIVSPGVSPHHPHYQAALREGIRVIGEVELALRYSKNKCLAITGSNGKTTTTLLVEHVLNFAGFTAKAVGNVGFPLTSAVDEISEDVIFVLELSSWQLETMQTKALMAAVCLNITPNHLDRHKTMEMYAKAKWNIKNCLKEGAPFFIQEKCFKEFGQPGSNPKLFGFNSECDIFSDGDAIYYDKKKQFTTPNTSNHEIENIMAAFALCYELGVSGPQFEEGIRTFKKPPHRIEYVCTLNQIHFYNDSKATSLDAVEKAVHSMKGSTYLIAGGVHKGASYTPWIKAFDGRVKGIFSIGEAAKIMKQDLEPAVPVQIFSSLEEAVKKAFQVAQAGENILLSPGCSSYDMFRDYGQRGNEFKRIVKSL